MQITRTKINSKTKKLVANWTQLPPLTIVMTNNATVLPYNMSYSTYFTILKYHLGLDPSTVDDWQLPYFNERMQELYPGPYTIEKYYNDSLTLDYRIHFEDPKEEVLWILRWS